MRHVSLDNTRLTAAAGAIGVSQALIEEAVQYARAREQFGVPLESIRWFRRKSADDRDTRRPTVDLQVRCPEG